MNKLVSLFVFSFIVTLTAACSSGSSLSEQPSTIGGNLGQDSYNGTFQQDGVSGSGNILFDLTESNGSITGNMILTNVSFSSCLCSSEVTGSANGFDVTLKTGTCTFTGERPAPGDCDNPDSITNICPIVEYSGDAQITLTGSGENLSGNFVVNGDACLTPSIISSNGGFSNTGTINVSR